MTVLLYHSCMATIHSAKYGCHKTCSWVHLVQKLRKHIISCCLLVLIPFFSTLTKHEIMDRQEICSLDSFGDRHPASILHHQQALHVPTVENLIPVTDLTEPRLWALLIETATGFFFFVPLAVISEGLKYNSLDNISLQVNTGCGCT